MNFQKFGVLTIVAVYLLIFVGGVVRSTGSGMGCPDWPKCFGSYIPPTKVEQLPLNYQEIYGAKLKGEVVFNPIKTWIEYLNRLLGAIIGLLVFATFLYSFRYLKSDIIVVIWSGIAVILTGFQGWVGSKVVSSELAVYMVSIHMLIAIIIVGVLIFVLFRTIPIDKFQNSEKSNFKLGIIVFALLISLVQVLLGTQVREAIDTISHTLGSERRGEWVENIGIKFLIHRSFSLIILGLNLFIYFKLKKVVEDRSLLSRLHKLLLVLIVFEIFTGVFLNYLNFPAFIQPFHLTLATLILGVQMSIIFILSPKLFFKVN